MFSEDQEKALEAIEQWRRCWDGKPFVLGGFAGTGKTTLISHLAEEWDSVAVCALCGKAANVLRSKGVEATTIHSLIYQPFEKNGRTCFKKRSYIDARVVIVDEASMVDHLINNDLLSFGLPVLYVGDHGQLEPIGTNPNLMKAPHVRLERIHRQAEGNPILRLAQAFRESREVPQWESKDGRLRVTKKDQFIGLINKGFQLICGFNKTRHKVNRLVRTDMGILDSDIPIVGETLMCLRNNKEFRIFNGQQVKVNHVGRATRRYIELGLTTEEGTTIHVPCLLAQFGNNVIEAHRDESVALFDFGYCLTAHKSQGSEWENVAVLEEISSLWDKARWRYTVATRAREKLVYCA